MFYASRVGGGGGRAAESARAWNRRGAAFDASPNAPLRAGRRRGPDAHCHMLRDLGGAEERLNRALAINPNNSLAWLFSGMVRGLPWRRRVGHGFC